jgi:tRNA pseudouridine13 synthase
VKLKHRPADFLVVERLRPGLVGEQGPHTVYRIEKEGLSTHESVMRIAREAGVRTEAVRVCGLKDRRARAVQHVSIEQGARLSIAEAGLSVRTIGKSTAPASSGWIEANEFTVVARDLAPEEVEALGRNLRDVREHGLPNFFDDQRFGAARAGKGWPMAEFLRGNVEEALRLLVATPGRNDPPEVAARKAFFRENWGRFDLCAPRAVGWHERGVFAHLALRPGDFRGALRFVPRAERLIQALAFQSWIWNRCVDRLVAGIVAPPRTGSLPAELGPLRFWRTPDEEERSRLDAVVLPLVGRGEAESSAREVVAEALREEKLDAARVGGRGLRGFELRAEPRAFVLRPDRLDAGDPGPDEDHPGRFALPLTMSLPRGAYATLVAKRLLA